MTKRIKIAVAGCGFIAQRQYFPALAKEEMKEAIEVAAVCDVMGERAQKICEQYGFGQAFSDFGNMLANADIDLVAILTPIPFHYEQAKAALLSGKHVYVQKTMTTTADEARHLNELAKQRGLILTASPGQMIDDYHKEAKKLIDQGTIGKVCFIRGQGGHGGHENQKLDGIDPSWYYKPGGGPVMDVAVYPITSITGLLGPAQKVAAFSGIAVPDRTWEGKKLEVEMDDNTVMLLDFGGGVFASIQGNFVTRASNTPQIELFGSKGVIQLGGWTLASKPLELFTPPSEGQPAGWRSCEVAVGELPASRPNHTVADLWHTIDCLRYGRKPLMSGDHAAHVIEIIEKVYESARKGVAIELDTDFSF